MFGGFWARVVESELESFIFSQQRQPFGAHGTIAGCSLSGLHRVCVAAAKNTAHSRSLRNLPTTKNQGKVSSAACHAVLMISVLRGEA